MTAIIKWPLLSPWAVMQGRHALLEARWRKPVGRVGGLPLPMMPGRALLN